MVLRRRTRGWLGLLLAVIALLGVSFVAPPPATADHEEEEPSGDGTVQVHKVDETGAPIAGVTFVLYTDNEGELGEPVEQEQACTTDAEGNCEITGLEEGTYWVVELLAPDGYDGAPPQQVEIEESCFDFPFFDLSDGGQGASEYTASFPPFFCFPECFPFCFIFDGATAEQQAAAEAAFAAAGAEMEASVSPFPECFPFCESEPEPVTLTFVNVRKPSGLSVTKTVNGSSETTSEAPLVIESGKGLDYVVTVANTGQLPLTITELTDTRQSDLSSCPQGVGSTLAAGASFACHYSGTAAEDTDGTASAAATDQFGRSLAASDQTFVDVINPGISLAVAANPSTVPAAGGQVTYNYVVTNTGDTPLDNIVVTDELSGASGIVPVLAAGSSGMVAAASFTGGPAAAAPAPGELAPGASKTYTKTALVSGTTSTTNIGRVTATHPFGGVVGSTATVTVTTEQSAQVLGVSLSRPSTPAAPVAPAAPATALAATGASSVSQLVRLGVFLVLVGVTLLVAGRRRRRPAE